MLPGNQPPPSALPAPPRGPGACALCNGQDGADGRGQRSLSSFTSQASVFLLARSPLASQLLRGAGCQALGLPWFDYQGSPGAGAAHSAPRIGGGGGLTHHPPTVVTSPKPMFSLWASSFSLFSSGGGNGNPLPCSRLENPRDGGAWRAAVYGAAHG